MDNDRYIYAIFMILLIGAWAVSWFANNRNRLSANLQQAVIWVLIFFGVILLYSFRDTLYTELNPAGVQEIDGETIIIRRGFDQHFATHLTINGQDIRFLIDTGASAVVLSKDDAEAVGIDANRLAFTGRASTANGTVRTASVTLDRVEFGPFIDYNIRASVNAGDLDESLLGMSYLSRFSRITIEGNRMILER